MKKHTFKTLIVLSVLSLFGFALCSCTGGNSSYDSNCFEIENGRTYATLQEAVTNAPEESTIKMTADCTTDLTYIEGRFKDLSLDMNGHNLTVKNESEDVRGLTLAFGKIGITNSSETASSKIDVSGCKGLMLSYGTYFIDNVNIELGEYWMQVNESLLYLGNTKVTVAPDDLGATIVAMDSHVVIDGADISSANKNMRPIIFTNYYYNDNADLVLGSNKGNVSALIDESDYGVYIYSGTFGKSVLDDSSYTVDKDKKVTTDTIYVHLVDSDGKYVVTPTTSTSAS